jgi:hypothetical protein
LKYSFVSDLNSNSLSFAAPPNSRQRPFKLAFYPLPAKPCNILPFGRRMKYDGNGRR